ncbi:hypothetical protein FPQ18DRAFT_329325 [Pyronema domesticum]|nr:hypothetical protein FPQ18DRAFT_329325 [Pyronema domesticum]
MARRSTNTPPLGAPAQIIPPPFYYLFDDPAARGPSQLPLSSPEPTYVDEHPQFASHPDEIERKFSEEDHFRQPGRYSPSSHSDYSSPRDSSGSEHEYDAPMYEHGNSDDLPFSQHQSTSKPFNRKSRAGKSHVVTPAGAGPGLKCTFDADGTPCNAEMFKVPSKLRHHLIEKHALFSPFQCDNCMRVFTRMSLRTRHLEKVPIIPNMHGPRTEERVCPHPPAIKSEDYKTRKDIEDALWRIKTDQKEVEEAIKLIKQYNPLLEGRKKRAGSGDRSGGIRTPNGCPHPERASIYPYPALRSPQGPSGQQKYSPSTSPNRNRHYRHSNSSHETPAPTTQAVYPLPHGQPVPSSSYHHQNHAQQQQHRQNASQHHQSHQQQPVMALPGIWDHQDVKNIEKQNQSFDQRMPHVLNIGYDTYQYSQFSCLQETGRR